MRSLKSLLICLSLALLCLSHARMEGSFQLRGGALQASYKPVLAGLVRVAPAFESADLDGDGFEERLALDQGRLRVLSHADAVIWESPEDWDVREFQVGDLNRDDQVEMTLLVWRPFQPWPVDRFIPYGGRIDTFHNEQGESCHVILVGWRLGAFRELWAGSAMVRPIFSLTLADLDNDGRQELAALESAYDKPGQATALTVWKWQGFGFTLIDRLEGSFQVLQTYHNDHLTWLVAQ